MKSKTALVTGASRRIGHAAAIFLVEQLLQIESHGGSVVFLSSLAARASVGKRAAYAAAKGAVSTLVKHFASALGAHGIWINAVASDAINTGVSSFARTDAGRDYMNCARWVSGYTLRVDGGSKL